MECTDTKSVVDKLKSCFTYFGLPSVVLADNSSPFNREIVDNFY